MKEIKIESAIQVYDNMDELPDQARQLMEQAIAVRENAYAPYSKFNVGAALLMDNGTIVTGSNQENASYPSGICAERSAIYYAGSQYPDEAITMLAITANSRNQDTTTPIPPCGACRQAIAEYEVKQESPIEIFFMGKTGQVYRSESLANLLPLVFDKNAL